MFGACCGVLLWTILFLSGCAGPEAPETPEAREPPKPSALPSATVARAPGPEPTATPVAYVGGKVCASCHAEQAGAWAGSDHDLAMQVATAETVLGDFDDASFTDAGTTTRFRRDGDRFFVRATGRDGAERDFPVPYVFGVRPLQQYLVDVGDGRLQAHPVAWDTEKKEWISLYPGEEIPPDDLLHWSRFALNWNQGCADCHSTDLRKQYDVEEDSYDTVWAEIDVSCEACHGPGAAHVAWARDASPGDASKGLLVPLDAGGFPGRDQERQRSQVDTCAPCHARRALVHPVDDWGAPLTDSWRPEILREDLYFPDGQILDEVYVYGSFAQSRMFAEGVTCTDCHDPHSLKLVAEGNALCTQCHEPARYDSATHTHHAKGSSGDACVACHMVETTYMQVDPRRDHGFHIPRPDLSVDLEVPNACNRCHDEESAQWARDQVLAWYGPDRPEDVHEARVIAAGRARAPEAEAGLAALVAHPARSAIVRATALHLLQAFEGEVPREASRRALSDPDPLVRSMAVANVAALARSVDDLEPLVPLLRDPSRLVRTEAAVSLSRVARERFADRSSDAAKDFEAALAEYRAGQMASADQPTAHMNLGVVHQNLGDDAAARTAYERANRIEPAFVPARFNRAMLDALAGRSVEAEAGFREVIRLAPELSEATYSLGLLLGENPARLEESAAFLRDAARSAPANARYQYNAGLAAQHLGRVEEAEGFLRAAVNLRPDDPGFRNALTILYVQQERWEEALPQAERLRALAGEHPEVVRLLETVRANASFD